MYAYTVRPLPVPILAGIRDERLMQPFALQRRSARFCTALARTQQARIRSTRVIAFTCATRWLTWAGPGCS